MFALTEMTDVRIGARRAVADALVKVIAAEEEAFGRRPRDIA